MLSVEGSKGGKLREWGVEPGEEVDIPEYYRTVNKRYQQQALESLREMAAKDEPFFLNYWPQIPIAVLRESDKFLTPNGGRMADAMHILDGYIGELMAEIKKLGIENNTLVVVMGDNGAFKQTMPEGGYTDWLFRGVKGQTLEGGVRVGAFAKWPGVLKKDSVVGDMIHVCDLYTTFARLTGTTDGIPRDRIVDGVDQLPLLLKGDTHGRRDYVHLYEMDVLSKTVKQQMKIHWPPPSVNPSLAPVFNLYWDPREEQPLQSAGVWTGTSFVRMRTQHLRMKDKFPDRPAARGEPYEDVENLRPETIAMVKTWKAVYGDARDVVLGVEGAGN